LKEKKKQVENKFELIKSQVEENFKSQLEEHKFDE